MAKSKNVVGKAQRSIKLILILLVAFAWLIVVMMVLNNNDEKKQQKLLDSAQTLMEDKLYIRAYNLYQEALTNYQTKENPKIEKDLLDICKEGNLKAEYYQLIEKRIEAGTAEVNEYVEYANYQLEEGSAMTAVNTLSKGEALFDDDTLTQLYESVKYGYNAYEIKYSDIKTPSKDWIIPANDGTKWGYINTSGKVVLDFTYEEATHFSNNYAVVKIDGVYTLIGTNGYWYAVDKNDLDEVTDICGDKVVGVKDGKYRIYSYTFQPLSDVDFENIYLNDNGVIVAKKDGKWAILSDKLENITDYVFDDVAVNDLGQVFYGDYAMVKDQDGYYGISRDGKPCFDTKFADAKGYMGGLIAVADQSGKWGYSNGHGEIVIDYQYEDARSFSYDLGAVKYAGKWGYVNRYNSMMIENDLQSAGSFISGMSLVTTKAGETKVVTLKYESLFE